MSQAVFTAIHRRQYTGCVQSASRDYSLLQAPIFASKYALVSVLKVGLLEVDASDCVLSIHSKGMKYFFNAIYISTKEKNINQSCFSSPFPSKRPLKFSLRLRRLQVCQLSYVPLIFHGWGSLRHINSKWKKWTDPTIFLTRANDGKVSYT